eukprot:CAMPEP_0113864102 /NCGR_PEP_ID=MMETSP0372-20130328/16971_1 /TAXON_ID=340204 /ORGANISM="Lankesteria abbotti" /LENGTH=166 /DNA_ID=CAMNT_0000846909 /DNA_START=689 /DNA_END=1189 /DNA_ORIENTATION=- /assembly_acc=CAM_ASM_000359
MWEEGVYPFMEDDAYSLQLCLVSFQVVVVTILLNMFTTIIIDAYTSAVSKRSNENQLSSMKTFMWTKMMILFGYTHELDDELHDRSRDVQVAFRQGGSRESLQEEHPSRLDEMKNMMSVMETMAKKLEVFVIEEELNESARLLSERDSLLSDSRHRKKKKKKKSES